MLKSVDLKDHQKISTYFLINQVVLDYEYMQGVWVRCGPNHRILDRRMLFIERVCVLWVFDCLDCFAGI